MTFEPAAWARFTSSPGSPTAKPIAAGRASSVASNASSSRAGTMWLITNGRSVSSRTRATCARRSAAGVRTAPRLPRAPASVTAATSSGVVAGQIGA